MAKPTKAAEFRSLSEEEIEKEIYDCQSSLFFARIAQKQRKVRLHFQKVSVYACQPKACAVLAAYCIVHKVLHQITSEQRVSSNGYGCPIVPLYAEDGRKGRGKGEG